MKKVGSGRLRLSNLQIVAIGYFCVCMIGTILLLLPISAVKGNTTLLQAIFTAVSACCVTGLVLVDTSTHWTLFGQLVIMILIQIGGLGFMTIGMRFMLLVRRRISLREREVMVESINAYQLGGIIRLTQEIVTGTLIVEGIGAALLAIRFIPEFGLTKGLFYSVFHAVSAFCNAGFDLMGIKEPFCSLVPYANDFLINFTVMALIIIGGIGFFIWEDLYKHGLQWKRYYLHTKVVLATTGILIFGGALLFFIFERSATGAEMPMKERMVSALFQSVTCRTAGFNTIDTGSMSEGSKLLSILLMFIGGSPGSTAGGIKTTTCAAFVLYMISGVRREGSATVFGRSLMPDALGRAISIFTINLGVVLIGALILCALQPFSGIDAMFEVFSAMGTVGLSTGITRQLTAASAGVITLVMFLGRVGSVSLASALLEKKAKPPVTLPTEKIIIG
ncbi:potassium/sodium uptake protein NtpJ [Anaerotignum neopropionicum]|uniref:Potassium/sodium uptake protein NtpJ n=1 Tax=Anaerotignum neopropionicum TaxID=36847 RepID=A0A136WIV5_9FIRM|nr:potassium transporter TrkG [Anaerotignum neopropionicum]KXL54435.1 potassium/sodium uptake protein NtpJ [Anaerotignum neopropionicum]